MVGDCVKDPKKMQLRFDPSQELEFSRFLSSVPEPTFWERSSELRAYSKVWLIIFGIAGFIWMGVNFLLTQFAG